MGDEECVHCKRRVESLWALVADEELPYDELPAEWRQRCTRHAVCDDCGKQGCEGVRTLYCPTIYGCSACGKVHGVARGCVPTPVNWTAGLTPIDPT